MPVATRYWPTPIATGTISDVYRGEVASVVISEGKGGSGYTSPPSVVFSSLVRPIKAILS